jgi:hypothetical protein
VASQTSSMVSPATLMCKVHSVKMKNPKGKQKYKEKIKGKGNKGKGGNQKRILTMSVSEKMKRRWLSSHVIFSC